jgi:hypothetical protein
MRIAKMPLGTKECGTLKASLVIVKAEMEAIANAHTEMAAGMRKELDEALNGFAAGMKEKRKTVPTRIGGVSHDRFK